MELDPRWVSAGVAAAGLFGTALVKWVAENSAGLKATQKLLFEKHDDLNYALQAYKLHVAETYVNRAALKELLIPMERDLEIIKQEMRDDRK